MVGRFLSSDPVVQSPNFTQSYNAYSYCFNNPLKFTDPSGYVVVSFAAEGEEMNDWNTYVHLSLVEMVNEKFGDGILSDIENARRLFQEGGGTNKVKGTLKFERDGETGKIILRFIPENSLQDKLFKKDFLVFTGTQVPGKERIDGTLTWHRKTIFGNKIVDSWSANSGSITLKPIPKGTWYLSNWRPRDEPGYVAQNVGFTIDITPNQYGRSDLRIHPDGFPPGTAGCIGLTGDSKDLIRFSNMMRYFLIYNDFMRLEVDY